MNLNQIKNILLKILNRRNIFLFGVLFLLVIISWIIIIKYATPSTKPLPLINVSQNKSSLSVERFTFSKNPDIPSKVEVFALKKDSALSLDKVKVIAKSLGFDSNPVAKNISSGISFEWKGGNNFTFFPVSGSFSYSLSMTDNQNVLNGVNKPTVSSATTDAQKFLESLDLWNAGFKPIKTYQFSNLGADPSEVQNPNGDIVEIWFGLNFNNLPVYLDYPQKPWVIIQVAHDSKIIKLVYQKPPQTEKSLGDYEVIGLNETVMALKKNQGSVVSFLLTNSEQTTKQIKALSEMKIKSSQLAYLSSMENGEILAPILVFEGNAIADTNQEGQAIVYLPAITQN